MKITCTENQKERLISAILKADCDSCPLFGICPDDSMTCTYTLDTEIEWEIIE
jgi:hypothetical protein